MTIQRFIEAAIEGGWKHAPFNPRLEEQGYSILHKALLDPLAWQAVGKVEGWSGDYLTADGEPEWLERMPSMLDALAEGKSIEEFIATL